MNISTKSVMATALFALLTACNQSAPPAQTQPSDTQTANTQNNTASDAHHDANASMATHSADYMQSMQIMHDDMTKAAQKANADVAFALGMIPHHQGAIDMANIQLKYGKDETMRKLAQDIIAAQQKEIELMQTWLNNAKDKDADNPQSEHSKAYLADMSMHDKMMKGVHHENPDVAFALGMIPHHQGAIDMANIELKYGKDETMRKLAQDIIAAQDPEITLMQDWLKTQGVATD